mgnify:CR=1 FL=1
MDKIIRCITSDGAVMASAIDASDIVFKAQKIHGLSRSATAALGRLLCATSMMGAMLKQKDASINLRVSGDGELGPVIAVADSKGNVRGYVGNANCPTEYYNNGKINVSKAVGKNGVLNVMRDYGSGDPYIGQVELVSGEIAEDITNYFATSEQIPTVCALGVLINKEDGEVMLAGGLLIQLLPGAFEDTIEKLEKYGQNHIVKIMEKMTEEEKDRLAEQVTNLDFDSIEHLYNELTKKEVNVGKEIEPISALKKNKLSLEELEEMNDLGKNVIVSNQFAVATMSGGQGTRLGYSKPKGTFKIDVEPEPKYLFEIVCDTLKRANKKYDVVIPWYIMTSVDNNDDIVEFFEENNYFDYPKDSVMFFKQGQMPLIDENGKVLMGENKLIKEASDGNGGIFKSMGVHGCLDDMEKRGVKWLFIGSIDNVLLKMVDPTLIGLAEDRGVLIATKSVLKNGPHERVGVICKKDGKVGVIEYSELSKELAEAVDEDGDLTYGESHIMCNLFNIEILKKLATVTLPYHKAHKKNSYLNENGELVVPTEPNSFKFETFIFDSFNYVNDIAILRGTREVDFAPVKNKDGVDSPETARVLYNNYWANNEE